MRPCTLLSLLVATVCGPLLVACSSGGGASSAPDSGHESPRDASSDRRPPTDATHKQDSASGPDAGNDAGRDASRDSKSDVTALLDGGAHTDAHHEAAVDAEAPPIDGAPDAIPDSVTPFDAGPPALRYVGRIDLGDPAGPRFEWSGTQVIARFTGTAITIQMADYGNYFNVLVDGLLQPSPIIGVSGTTDYPLASGLASGTHEVILYRRTEAQVSTTQILGVTFPAGGALLPPAAPSSRRIEVIGDSISCGLGVLGDGGPTCTPTNANEDHYDTYEAIAARDLGADIITTSWSGKGVYENYGGAMTATMPDLYPYTLPNEPSAATLWAFASWTPDVVVIDLGTNDFWNDDPGPGYETAYAALLQTVRGNYPSARIICANGPMLLGSDFTAAETYIQGAIAQVQTSSTGGIEYLSFGIQGSGNGYGCDYHPSPPTHAEMAATLEAAITSALGW